MIYNLATVECESVKSSLTLCFSYLTLKTNSCKFEYSIVFVEILEPILQIELCHKAKKNYGYIY